MLPGPLPVHGKPDNRALDLGKIGEVVRPSITHLEVRTLGLTKDTRHRRRKPANPTSKFVQTNSKSHQPYFVQTKVMLSLRQTQCTYFQMRDVRPDDFADFAQIRSAMIVP